jgi:pimeloyl-ACP methyl ester carboxylesterase
MIRRRSEPIPYPEPELKALTSSHPARLARAGLPHLAYRRTPGRTPGVVFLGGFKSNMTGIKATAIEAHCRTRGQVFLRFDYRGHGDSGGTFTEGTIGRWRDDAVAVLDALTEGPQVLVGSSMGGWIMVLAALARPDRVSGLVGVAAAPDFTEDLMWAQFDDATRTAILRDGVYQEQSTYSEAPYPVTRELIEDGRHHLVLRASIPVTCPVRLLHGMRDADVPWNTSRRLLERLEVADATLTLIKDGEHRLSREEDLKRIFAAVDELLDRCT